MWEDTSGSEEVQQKEWVELDPENAYAFGSKGAVYLELRKKEKARAALDRAIELDPDDRWASNLRASLG